MAVRGTKPTATVIKLVTGVRKSRVARAEPQPKGRPVPPTPLTGRPLALWKRFISRAWWLSSADGPKAWLWCHLQHEAEVAFGPPLADGTLPEPMISARIGQLRTLGSELGMDPGSRARFGTPPAAKRDPFFD